MTATESPGREAQWAAVLRRVASVIDRRPNLVLPVWIFAYFAVLWRPLHRPMWFDELLTYYAATAPTAAAFLHSRFLDPTPPLSYVLVRASVALFGDSAFAARIPSAVGFLVASLIVYGLITRRFGGGVGLAALAMMWSSSLTIYAVESRPYGVVLAFFTLATLCWLKAIRQKGWSWWHAGLAGSLVAMFATHCFSPPFAAAIGVGELVRARAARRIDKRVWASILAPLGVLPLYLPLVRNARALLCPAAFAPTWISFPKTYLAVFAPLLPAIGMIAVLWAASYRRGERRRAMARPYETAFAVAAVVAPSITISYAMWSGSPFWLRYCIGSVLGAVLILAVGAASASRRNAGLAVGLAGLILVLFGVTTGGTGRLADLYENTSSAYRAVRTDLPFVAASGVTFLEMDHREAPDFIHRLYYLTDRESALRRHSTIFEGFPVLKQWFPIRGNVAQYRDFVRENGHFMVLGTKAYPEDWLLGRLEEDGAEVRLVGKMKTGYQDSELYEVVVK